jgi:hypothetical protein
MSGGGEEAPGRRGCDWYRDCLSTNAFSYFFCHWYAERQIVCLVSDLTGMCVDVDISGILSRSTLASNGFLIAQLTLLPRA